MQVILTCISKPFLIKINEAFLSLCNLVLVYKTSNINSGAHQLPLYQLAIIVELLFYYSISKQVFIVVYLNI